MKTLILIILLMLTGCAGQTVGFIYQYDTNADIKIETQQKPKQNNLSEVI